LLHVTCRYVRRDLWRNKAIEIRAQFERNRNVRDPRAVAALLNEAEREVQKFAHPDPYRRELLSISLSLFFTVRKLTIIWLRTLPRSHSIIVP
jgi:hypothetical protein